MNPTQFEEQTQSLYRLRSARNKRRSVIEARDKTIRALDKDHNTAFYAFHRRPWIDLEEPYQRGWYRHFELTKATAIHKDAAMYAEILEHTNTVQYSRRKDFTKKKRQQGRKLRFGIEQYLSRLTDYSWRKSGMGRREAELFEWRPGLDNQGRYHAKLVFLQPWRYELKVRPRMITQVQQIDPDLQRRLQELDNRFKQHHLKPRRDKIIRGFAWHYHWKDSKAPEQKAKRSFRNLPLHLLIADTD